MTTETGFSGIVDHFGLAQTGSGIELVLVESSTTPHPKGTEEARNADGDIADMGYYKGGPGTQAECVYELQSGTLSLADIGVIGVQSTATNAVSSINVETSNGAWPRITVSGITGAAVNVGGNTFTLPDIDITGTRTAQDLGNTAVGGTVLLQSSSLTAEGSIEHVLASTTAEGAVCVVGCELAVSVSVVSITGAPTVTWTSLSSFYVETTQEPTYSAGMTKWTDGTFEGKGYIEADS